MGPALSPGAVAQEMAACAVLGGVLGAARAVLPTRGRAAFLPDMLFVGAVLMALQSYAVSQSQAGQLRGYMALAAFCAAGAVQAALRPLCAAAEAFAGKLLLGPVRLAARCIAPWKAARAAAKVRRNEKRLAKKQKKSWFKGLKAEFSKIIWPDQKSLTKETIAVLVVSVLLGVIISVVDLIVRFGIEFIVK